jgi:soluble lytic murein transglycosylase-like protein
MELNMPIDKVAQYDDLIEESAKEFNVPANLIRAVIRQESSGDPNAVGPRTKYGVARGLMQVMDSATDEVAKMGVKVTDPFDPKQNIRAGAAYLAINIKRVKKAWKTDDPNDLYRMAAGAYHSGIGNLQEKGYDTSQLGPQGQNYVKKVMANFSTYSEMLDSGYPVEDRANAIESLASKKKPSTSA